MSALAMPDSQELLALTERAEHEHPIDRALSILSVFLREPRSVLAALPIHARDSLLLASRVAAFGSRLDGVARCPSCGCRVDACVDLPEAAPLPTSDSCVLQVAGEPIELRLPNSRDLADAVRLGDVELAGQMLVQRCQLSGESSEAAARAIDAEIERLCELSSVELSMACPECSQHLVVPVDIGGFFWEELRAHALRLIEEVDALALRYGWSEADILALPESRRRRYLELSE
jgi:hypothetical protein